MPEDTEIDQWVKDLDERLAAIHSQRQEDVDDRYSERGRATVTTYVHEIAEERRRAIKDWLGRMFAKLDRQFLEEIDKALDTKLKSLMPPPKCGDCGNVHSSDFCPARDDAGYH